MLARGLELSPLGSIKDCVTRRGIEMDHMIKSSSLMMILQAMRMMVNGDNAKKAMDVILEHVCKVSSLELFTNEYKQEKDKSTSADKDILNALNSIK